MKSETCTPVWAHCDTAAWGRWNTPVWAQSWGQSYTPVWVRSDTPDGAHCCTAVWGRSGTVVLEHF